MDYLIIVEIHILMFCDFVSHLVSWRCAKTSDAVNANAPISATVSYEGSSLDPANATADATSECSAHAAYATTTTPTELSSASAATAATGNATAARDGASGR